MCSFGAWASGALAPPTRREVELCGRVRDDRRLALRTADLSVLLIWLGALCIVGGVLLLSIPPIWRGRLSGRRSRSAGVADGTLEPRRPGAGFGLKTSWPGFALIAVGALLMLVGAMIQNPSGGTIEGV